MPLQSLIELYSKNSNEISYRKWLLWLRFELIINIWLNLAFGCLSRCEWYGICVFILFILVYQTSFLESII